MPRIKGEPAYAVWLCLVAATGLSWWLGADHGIADRQAATAVILAISFTKIWLVSQWFMELRHAPPGLRLTFNAWILTVGTALVILAVTD